MIFTFAWFSLLLEFLGGITRRVPLYTLVNKTDQHGFLQGWQSFIEVILSQVRHVLTLYFLVCYALTLLSHRLKHTGKKTKTKWTTSPHDRNRLQTDTYMCKHKKKMNDISVQKRAEQCLSITELGHRRRHTCKKQKQKKKAEWHLSMTKLNTKQQSLWSPQKLFCLCIT